MSFYGILSLAPLLLAIVAMLGWWMDRERAGERPAGQIGAIVGAQGAAVIAGGAGQRAGASEGIAASVVGFAVLLFGATGVFGELQEAFERVWAQGRGAPPKPSWWHTATLRLRGIGYILVFGFLLLVSLVISTLLTVFSGWAGSWLPLEILLRVLNEVVAFVICARAVRRPDAPERRAQAAACASWCSAPSSAPSCSPSAASCWRSTCPRPPWSPAYGAAGSLIVLLMWIYFSSAVLLFGAGCARALEEHVAEARPPQDDAQAHGHRGSNERRCARSARRRRQPTPAAAAAAPAVARLARPQHAQQQRRHARAPAPSAGPARH